MLRDKKKIRFAVVGLGYISQMAVLPAFKRAKKNSRLTAFVSGDPRKWKVLGKKYGVERFYSYERYDEFLHSGSADAVYIALPNNLHKEYSIRALNAGLHVLCEKPMALSASECKAMIAAAEKNNRKLMIAYRLHFEPANLDMIKLIKQGKIGEPRIFNSTFTRQVKKGDIRLKAELGGGSIWDLGIYCINAARYAFQDDPTDVQAFSTAGGDPRFKEVDEMTSVILRFPKDRVAAFTSSFGGADTSAYEIIGTKGTIRVDPGYDYALPLSMKITIGEKTSTKKYPRHDQFGPELLYFSDCVLSGKNPEPSGAEGLIDTQIIRAIYDSAQRQRALSLPSFKDKPAVSPRQKIVRPAVEKPDLVHASTMSN